MEEKEIIENENLEDECDCCCDECSCDDCSDDEVAEFTPEEKELYEGRAGYLYRGIKDNYSNFESILLDGNMFTISFHKDFVMDVIVEDIYYVYINGLYFYDMEEGDADDIMDSILSGDYVFMEIKEKFAGRTEKRIIAEDARSFKDRKSFIHVWTITKTLK